MPTIWSRCLHMADPRNELADIITPAAPAMTVPAGHGLLWWVAVGLMCVSAALLLAWLGQRRRPARKLAAIAAAAAQQQDTPVVLAGRLDAWARMRFRLARVDAANCPAGLDPAKWANWVATLAQLRFAPSRPDAYAVLGRLCESARSWRRRV